MADLPVLHDHEGTPRVLAALPPYPWDVVPRLAAAHPTLPRDQWREIDLAAAYAPPILDQGRSSSCVGHGTATAGTVAWQQKGAAQVRLSAGFIYAQINGGRDAGAVVSDAAVELTRTGACLESEVPEGVYFRQQIPQAAYQTALRYRMSRSHACPSFDEIGTALSLGFPVSAGFLLGNNFMRPPANGVVPVPDYVVGGHCIALLGLVNRGGRWLVKFQNSWGPSWGLQGCAYLTEDFVGYTVRQYNGRLDAFALEAMSDDPQDPDAPPAATE